MDAYWKSIILGFATASFERTFAVELRFHSFTMQIQDLRSSTQAYLEEISYFEVAVETVALEAIGSNLGQPMLDCKHIKPNLDIHSKERSHSVVVEVVPGTKLVDSDIEVPTSRYSYFVLRLEEDSVNFGMEDLG